MTDYVLKIKLLSPLTSAAGEGRIGVVDRDIVFDDLGLPILPGRRLKGLWREAYRDVADAWQASQIEKIPTPAEDIFGYSGRRHGDGGACIHIGNAELKEAAFLKDWLTFLQHHKNQRILPDDVVQYYATVRAQTSINRDTGAAKENTLRLTRTLKAGRIFWAPIYFGTTDQTSTPNQALINAVALGAAAIQHIGTARTRGLGKVRCCLLKRENGNLIDLTPNLKLSSLPTITDAGLLPSNQKPPVQTGAVSGSDTHILRYRLTLREPIVIPIADGDPNTVVTRQDIPGSHLWGIAAWHYLHQNNHGPSDVEVFRRAFLEGGLRFLPAYPERKGTPQRLIPIPHSIREFKDQYNEDPVELVDFAEEAPGKRPTKRVARRYAQMSQGSVNTQTVKTERNYHHARAVKNRSIGRSLGAEVPDGGTFFTYEAIQAGQTFQGTVLGSANDLSDLKTWLQNLNTVSIGRSRSAQYGKSDFEWIDSAPQKLSGLAEWDGFAMQQTPSNLDKKLIITTLSPLLTLNDNGHPDARFPIRELAEALKLNISELTLSTSYTRTEMVSGYNTYLRLPRQQWQAIAAGSVFVFRSKKNPDQSNLLQLEQNGLGLRKGEGYGRVAVNRQGNLNNQQIFETPLDDPDKAITPYVPNADIHSDLQTLLRSVIRNRCMAEMRETAMNIARRIKNEPSNSLIGRLRLFLKQKPATAITHLDNLRKPAADSLKKCQINTRGYPNTLYDLFRKTLENPSERTDIPIETQAKNLLKNGEADDIRQTLIAQLQRDGSEEMVKVFLNHLLTALYRK